MAVLVMNIHKQNVKVINGSFERNREAIFEYNAYLSGG